MTPTLKSFVIIRAESSFRIFLVMGGTFFLSFLFAYTRIQPLSRLDSIESIERRLSFHPKERSNDTVDEFDEELYTFKILQLADLHFGEAEFTDWGPLQDEKSAGVIQKVIEKERPDLVVLSGDQLTGNDIDENATEYYSNLISILQSSQDNIKWVMIFGNHDDAPLERKDKYGNIIYFGTKTSREDLLKKDMSFSSSFSKRGPIDMPGNNYFVPLYLKNVPVLNIYLFDSGGGVLSEKIDKSQTDWLKTVSKKSSLPGVAFQHIPSSVDDFEFSDNCVGQHDDSIDAITVDSEIVGELASSKVLFLGVGHDHGNGYCCRHKYNWIDVCFGRHSGYGGYSHRDWARGARIYLLTHNGKQINWESWTRLESGEVVDTFMGSHSYPSTL